MATSLDCLELCRLCLVKEHVTVPIFKDGNDVQQIFLKIAACLPVKVSRDDKLPKKICTDCVCKVESFYQFWNTTANAEKQLLQWLGEVDDMGDKQEFVQVLNTNVMKQEQSSDNRLEGNFIQVEGQNSIEMSMIDNMSIITMPAGSEQQFTTVPMDTNGTVQTVQVVSGSSTHAAYDQGEMVEEVEESEEDDMDDGCDNKGLPVKEENEDDQGEQQTTYISVPVTCDEAGPSGLQQQKISDLTEMTLHQSADETGDPKSGKSPATAASSQMKRRRRIPVQTRLVIDEMGKRYNAIVPADSIIFPDETTEDAFEEVSIIGGSAAAAAACSKTPLEAIALKNLSAPIFTCRKCKVFFSNGHMLNRHLRNEHPKKKLPSIFNTLIEQVRKRKSMKTKKSFTIEVSPSVTVAIEARAKSEPKEEIGEDETTNKGVSEERGVSFECVEVKNDDEDFEYIESEGVLTNERTKSENDVELIEGDMEYSVVDPIGDDSAAVESETEFPEESTNLAGEDVVEEEEMAEQESPTMILPDLIHKETPEFSNESSNLDSTETVANNYVEKDPIKLRTVIPAADPRIEIIFTETAANQADEAELTTRTTTQPLEECILYAESDVPTMALSADEVPKEALTVEVETEKDPRDNMIENDDYRCAVVEIITEQNQKKIKIYGKAYYCAYCNFECKSRAGMYVHISKSHKEWPLTVARREAARIHQAKMKGANLKFVCFYCPFAASNRSTLVAHSRRKHPGLLQPMPQGKKGPRIQPWQCPLCEFTSNCKRKHETHMERKHVTEMRYACHICSKKFKTKCDLGAHIKFQHVKTPVVCDVCGKVCGNSNALHVHQKREHFLPKYECHLCKRRMVSQANLDEHIIKQHENRSKFMCENCGKVFNQHSKLIVHSRTHTGEKPHPCPTCGKSFARRAVLRQHMMIHTGKRPYICDICGKSFAQKPGLICHRKSHPGEKPPLPVVYIDHILKEYENEQAAQDQEPVAAGFLDDESAAESDES